MGEGLEALEDIKGNCDLFDEGYQWDNEFSKQFDSDIDTIENELKEKEELQKLLDHERELNNHLITHEIKALQIIKPFLKNIRLEENEKGEYEILIDVINNDKPLVIAKVNSKEDFDLVRKVLYEND